MKSKAGANSSLFRKAYHIVFFVLLSCTCFAQATFKGKVLNEATGEPLAGASIYFNNTSYGTASNQNGEFSIPFPSIPHPELIISSVGFDIISYKVANGEDINRRYVFKMMAKQSLMQDIVVLPDATRRKYLKIFSDNFLGITQEGATSKLKNIDGIYFTKDPADRYSFKAYCDTPLVIVNKMLGYRVYFQLQEFYYNENTGATSFYGFTRYEEMGDKKRWLKHRRKAYYGSTMHFFRSLISHKLNENSFKVFFIRTDSITKPDGRIQAMDMAIPTTDSALVRKDSSETEVKYVASWKIKLMVQYNKDPASKAYLRQNTFLNGSLPVGFRAYMVFKEGINELEIDSNGILINPMDISFSGYWIYEKAANLLPYDYNPDAN